MNKRLLLVLDLNGTLVLRSRSGRTTFHRPYLRTLLHYLSLASSDPTISPIEVVVWSSARPHSVEKMVNDVFGSSSSLLATWDRTHLGLTLEDYNSKVQVTKDLRRLWAVFPHHSSATTILLDDSATKARLQPNNHLCVSDYNRAMHKETKTALEAVQAGVEPPTQPDQTLLAVIGVLETLRKESDIASWIRCGSLFNFASSCQSHPEPSAAREPGPEVAKPIFWWKQPDIMEFWIRAGQAALQKLEINVAI